MNAVVLGRLGRLTCGSILASISRSIHRTSILHHVEDARSKAPLRGRDRKLATEDEMENVLLSSLLPT
jgi:hypothetical protein